MKTVTFRADDIRRLGQDHVRNRLGELSAGAKFGKSQTPPDLTVTAGRWSTRLEVRPTTSKVPVGAVTLEAVALVDGVERERLVFVVDIRRKARVAVAAKELSMGATLRADDIVFEEREVTADTSDVVLHDALPVGATVTRRIAAGTSLIARDFRARPVIERGDTVTLRFRNGPLTVTGIGRTQGAGAPGDRIAVLNAESNKVVYGTVVDSRTVDVRPRAARAELRRPPMIRSALLVLIATASLSGQSLWNTDRAIRN
jgi:flagella basal body P-ring formation protein FlgA